MIAAIRAAVLSVLVTTGTAIADNTVNIPGTTVSVTTPDWFQTDDVINGLVDRRSGATLIVTELPGEAHSEMSRLFSSIETLNVMSVPKGIRFDTLEQLLTANGAKIPLAHGIQDDASGRFEKWMALFGGAKTVLTTMQIPSYNSFDSKVIRDVYASVKLGLPPAQTEIIDRLPFTFDLIKPFTFVNASTASGILLSTDLSSNTDIKSQPYILIFRQVSDSNYEPLEQMAETQLRTTSSFYAATIHDRSSVAFAGSSGILLEGVTEKDGIRFDFRQYFSIIDDKFIRLVAVAPVGTITDVLTIVENIADSVEIK